MAFPEGRVALVLHGGAGVVRGRDYQRQLRHMSGVVEMGRDRLMAGDAALDVAQAVVTELESAGLYVAGRGASPNSVGRFELDASLMEGTTGRAGAVAALQGFQSPIAVARRVLDATPHVMLAGDGAAAFARAQGLEEIEDEAAWFTGHTAARGLAAPSPGTGTVGCVALDREGALAAATSTGGTTGKLYGRVGDTPVIGAGTWADRHVAVSCTGVGEFFIRAAVAAQIGFRLRLAGQGLAQAAGAALAEAKAQGGEGGLIALGAAGDIAMPFNTEGMSRAALHPDGRIAVEVY